MEGEAGFVPQQDAQRSTEHVGLTPRYDNAAASDRGGRPSLPNQDAWFSADVGMHMAEVGGKVGAITSEEDKVSQDDRISALVERMQDVLVDGHEVSQDRIKSAEDGARKLIEEGKLDVFNALADGAGGHGGGEDASSIAIFAAVESIVQIYTDDPDHILKPEDLQEAIMKANNAVNAYNESKHKDSKSTLLLHVGDFVAGVGDSHAYLVRKGDDSVRRILTADTHGEDGLIQIIEEDRDGWLKGDRKIVNASVAYKSVPYLSNLSKAIGEQFDGDVAVETVKVSPGDKVILADDGVYGSVDKDENAHAFVDAKFGELLAEKNDDDDYKYTVNEALNLAHGAVFKKYNLDPLEDGLSVQDEANKLANEDVGKQSGDNATIVIGRKNSIEASGTEKYRVVAVGQIAQIADDVYGQVIGYDTGNGNVQVRIPDDESREISRSDFDRLNPANTNVARAADEIYAIVEHLAIADPAERSSLNYLIAKAVRGEISETALTRDHGLREAVVTLKTLLAAL